MDTIAHAQLCRYQATLPYVRAHDGAGQWELFDNPASRTDLQPLPDLAIALTPEAQLELFASRGVLRGPRWRRESAEGEFRGWKQLDLALDWRDQHLGCKWEERHLRTMADVRAQCWGRSECEAARFRVRWLCDAFVCPVSGEVIELPHNERARRMLELAVLACQSGTGGVEMGLSDWAAVLGCSRRSIWDLRSYLGELLEVRQLWAPAPGNVGSRRGHLLVRVGPRVATLVALERRAREPRHRAWLVARGIARLAERALHHRARARAYDVAGATWRGARWGRAAVCSRGEIDGRTREGRAFNRQELPLSPPLTGLRDPAPRWGAPGAGPRTPIECEPLRGSSIPAKAAPDVTSCASGHDSAATVQLGRGGAVALEGEALSRQPRPPEAAPSTGSFLDGGWFGEAALAELKRTLGSA
jgi:hypothetical protein